MRICERWQHKYRVKRESKLRMYLQSYNIIQISKSMNDCAVYVLDLFVALLSL